MTAPCLVCAPSRPTPEPRSVGEPLSPEAQRGADVVVLGWYCRDDDGGMPVPRVVLSRLRH